MTKNDLLKSFYHRGRKTFVSWTTEEIARRVNADMFDVGQALRGLARAGLMTANNIGVHGTHISAWKLTSAGQAKARAIMAAQEVVRSA